MIMIVLGLIIDFINCHPNAFSVLENALGPHPHWAFILLISIEISQGIQLIDN